MLERMDRTGRVNGVHKQLIVAKKAQKIRAEPPPLPGKGPYRFINVDIPWPSWARNNDPSCPRLPPYPTTSLEEICAMRVPDLAHEDCVLSLWIPNADLIAGNHLPVLEAWRFRSVTLLTWVKDRIGIGDWLRGQSEQCVIAVHGNPTVELTKQSTVLFAPAPREHSRKPPEFYDLVESLCPAPRYADLFSRYRHNDNWDPHGDDAPPVDEKPYDAAGPRESESPVAAEDLSIPPFLRRVPNSADAEM
jgi:N6-adenosine-specific RNA methylase IME4